MMDDPLPANLVQCWEGFLNAAPPTIGASGVCDEVFAHPVLFPLQRVREMAKMLKCAAQVQPRVAMEIGADKGGSVLCWLLALPTLTHFIACEIRGCPYRGLFERAFPHVQFLWIEDSSYTDETLERVRRFLGDLRLDALFIDGDKSWFFQDFECYRPLVRPGGVVFMHDVTDPAPGEAFHKVRDLGYRTEVIHDTRESAAATARRKQKLPPAHPHERWLRHWKGASCGVGVIHIN